MGNGNHLPIERVRPGDLVVAGDPIEGTWSSQLVLSQWSHVYDGRLASATLSDGSHLSATDGHLFWVDSDKAWFELGDVKSGDRLLTPTGVVVVETVVVYPAAETLVWDLDTAGPDTFAIQVGGSDVLVHNSAGCPYAFKDNPAEFENFGRSLHDGFEGAGYGDVEFTLQGSAVDGRRYQGGTFGPDSDFDLLTGSDELWLEIDELIQRNPELDEVLKPRGDGTFLIDSDEAAEALGLDELRGQITEEFGHEPNFVVGPNDVVIGQPGIYVPNVPLGES